MAAREASPDRSSSKGFFMSEMPTARSKGGKMGKLDRGALGSSMMSGNSSEERDSIARRTNQSKNSHMAQVNLYSSIDDTSAGGLTGMPA